MQEGKVYLDQDYDIKITLLDDELRLKNAMTASKRAEELYRGIREFDAQWNLFARQANSRFVELSEYLQQKLKRRGWLFYTFIGKGDADLCDHGIRPKRIFPV